MLNASQTLVQLNEKLKVLYVEDSTAVRESTCDILEEFFKYVDTAEDGAEGLRKYQIHYAEHAQYYAENYGKSNSKHIKAIILQKMTIKTYIKK